MRPLADVRHDLDQALALVEQLHACVEALDVAEAVAPVPGLRGQIADVASEARKRLTFARCRLASIRVGLQAVRAAIACYARMVVKQAREGADAQRAEVALLALLGGAPLERGDLTEVEHAYVVAALAAREATGQDERKATFERFVAARDALLGGRRAA